jgi:hypothetical protein
MGSIWRIPPPAFFLAILLFGGGPGFGLWIGSWIFPFLAAFGHGGWAEVGRIPISERIFAGVPAFLESTSLGYDVVNVGRVVLAFFGAVVFGVLGKRWWEYLVVDKYGWMTREDVEEFYKRQPPG